MYRVGKSGLYRWFDAILGPIDGGYSSGAERLSVAQDVVGSIPTSRPNFLFPHKFPFSN